MSRMFCWLYYKVCFYFQEKITKTRDDIYNHLHETSENSDLNDSPYDHAQCLTEIQSTQGKVLEDNYTHINTLC